MIYDFVLFIYWQLFQLLRSQHQKNSSIDMDIIKVILQLMYDFNDFRRKL